MTQLLPTHNQKIIITVTTCCTGAVPERHLQGRTTYLSCLLWRLTTGCMHLHSLKTEETSSDAILHPQGLPSPRDPVPGHAQSRLPIIPKAQSTRSFCGLLFFHPSICYCSSWYETDFHYPAVLFFFLFPNCTYISYKTLASSYLAWSHLLSTVSTLLIQPQLQLLLLLLPLPHYIPLPPPTPTHTPAVGDVDHPLQLVLAAVQGPLAVVPEVRHLAALRVLAAPADDVHLPRELV